MDFKISTRNILSHFRIGVSQKLAVEEDLKALNTNNIRMEINSHRSEDMKKCSDGGKYFQRVIDASKELKKKMIT